MKQLKRLEALEQGSQAGDNRILIYDVATGQTRQVSKTNPGKLEVVATPKDIKQRPVIARVQPGLIELLLPDL